MLCEKSFNNVVKMSRPKPIPDMLCVKNAVENLPLRVAEDLVILGTGDYDCYRSTRGSVVIEVNEAAVIKIPLGETSRDPYKWASSMKESVGHFSGLSPKTLVFVGTAEDGRVMPILLQEKVNGKPLCEAPIKKALKVSTLRDIKAILLATRDWCEKGETYDICGQSFKSVFGKFVGILIPFLSDNIMLNDDGRALLVDNTMKNRSLEPLTSKQKRKDAVRLINLKLSLSIINLLIVVSTVNEKISGWGQRADVQNESI